MTHQNDFVLRVDAFSVYFVRSITKCDYVPTRNCSKENGYCKYLDKIIWIT